MINKREFLEGLKESFEVSESNTLNFQTKYKELESWDSLTKYSIMAYINDNYKVEINSEMIEKTHTIDELYNIVNSKI